MSWRTVTAIYALLALVTIVTLVADRVAPPPDERAAAPVGPSLLETDAASVTTVTFRKPGSVVRATRQDGTWETLEPPGVRISPDLIDATVATLTTGQAAERLDGEPERGLAAYGLESPAVTMEIVAGPPPMQPVTVALGAHNPTQTAVYARRGDRPTIYLVGMNLRYYLELIFEAATGG